MPERESSPEFHRNLLFGLLALQVDYISRDQLTAATQAWLQDRSKSLDEILVQQGAVNPQTRDLLLPLVEQHIRDHGGLPSESLAALSSLDGIAADLRQLGDSQLEATLSIVDASGDRSLDATLDSRQPEGGPVEVPEPGKGENRYRVLRLHAWGGLGTVSVAKDLELNRHVALKEIQPRFADDDASRSRFVLEAEVTGGLEHPGIVPVYGLGKYEDGRPFYAMRFIQGDSLKEAADRFHGRAQAAKRAAGDSEPAQSKPAQSKSAQSKSAQSKSSKSEAIDSKAVEPSARADFTSVTFRKLLGRFVDVCHAIEYAHSRGVLHRDLKPGNVMLGKYGETLVVDWGLAKTQDSNDHWTGDESLLQPASASGSAATLMGSAIGTPAYMPPEQAAGNLDELGPASDVYSLGATLYYLLTGQPPFSGSSRSVLEDVKQGRFPTPRSLQATIPKPLEAICCRAMMRLPSERYASPEELAEDVEQYLADEPVGVYAEPLTIRMRRWLRKHQTVAVTSSAVVLLTIVGLSLFSSIVSSKNSQLTELNGTLDSRNSELSTLNQELDSRNLQLNQTNAELIASNQRADAEAAQARAAEARERQERDRAENALYLSDLRLASNHMQDRQHALSYLRLLEHFPLQGQSDRRGWEWYHLLGQAEPSLTSWAASPANVASIDWSSDGQKLVTAQFGGLGAVVWDAEQGNQILSIGEGRTIKLAVDWHPTEERFAWGAAVNDAQIRIYDIPTQQIVRLSEDMGSHRCIRFSPSGNRLAVGAIKIKQLPEENTLVVWEYQDGAWRTLSKRRIPFGTGVDDVEWSPTGEELLVVGRGVRTWIVDPTTLEVLKQSPERGFTCASWHPTKRLLACGNHSGEIVLLNADSMKIEKRFGAHLGELTSVAWSPDGQSLASCSSDHSVKVWSADDYQLVSRYLGHSTAVNEVSWRPDSQRLASCGLDGRVNVWPRQQKENVIAIQGIEEPGSGTIQNRHRFQWLDDQTLRVSRTPQELVDYHARTGEIGKRHALPDGSWRLLSENQLYRFDNPGQGVVVSDLDAEARRETLIPSTRNVWGNPFDNDVVAFCRKPIKYGAVTGDFFVKQLSSEQEIRLGSEPLTQIDDVCWSPDQQYVVVVGGGIPSDGGTDSYAGWANLFNPKTGEVVSRVRIGGSRIRGASAAWSPDSKHLVAANQDGLCQVYQVPDMQTLLAKHLHRLPVESLSWHPTEARVASGSGDRTVKIWDPFTGDVFLTFSVASPIAHVAWSPTGQRVAALDTTGRIHVWDAEAGTQLAAGGRLRRRLKDQLTGEMYNSIRSSDYRTALTLGQKTLLLGEALEWRSYYEVGLLAAQLGRESIVQSCASTLIARYADSPDMMAAYFTVWATVLLPDTLEDYNPAIDVARRVLASEPQDQQFQVCLAAALLRAGRVDDAYQQLQAAANAENRGKGSPAFLSYFLALAEWKRDQVQAAQRHIAEGNRLCAEELAAKPTWFRELALRVLRRQLQPIHQQTGKQAGPETSRP